MCDGTSQYLRKEQIQMDFKASYFPPFALGLNPTTMRGSKTGVYIGVSGSEAAEAFSRDPEELLGYSMTGCQHAMLANRLSYFFDFTGIQTFLCFGPIKYNNTDQWIKYFVFVLFIKI